MSATTTPATAIVTKEVEVTITVRVSIDASKFYDGFLADFRASFYDFADVDDHLKYLAALHARGRVTDDDFIEGYGQASDMGIKLNVVGQTEEVL